METKYCLVTKYSAETLLKKRRKYLMFFNFVKNVNFYGSVKFHINSFQSISISIYLIYLLKAQS